MDGEAVVLLVVVALGLVVVCPVFGIAAWVKVRRLEARARADGFDASQAALTRRVFALEKGIAQLESRIANLPGAPVRSPELRHAGVSTPSPAAPETTPPEGALSAHEQPSVAPALLSSIPAEPEPASALPPTSPFSEKSETFNLETLIAGRWLNRIGLLAVAVGVAYFLKLTIDNRWVGPRGQVASGILLGTGLLAFSPWLLRKGYVYFADGVTGLGAAVLYLSLWAGGHYYQLFSLGVAFAAMIVVTAATCAIAVGRGSQPVALLALIGGFLTPWLVSTGGDHQVTLFTYLAVLDAGLLLLARKRDWRLIEVPAFLFTQIYFWVWCDRFYMEHKLLRTSAFAVLFFAEFAALPILRSRRTGKLHLEQVALVLLNAGWLLFALRRMLWPKQLWVLTLAVLALGAAHLLMARAVLLAGARAPLARLIFAGLALTLVTIAVPVRLDGKWVTLAWAIEGAVLMWTGFRARLLHLRAAAFLLFGLVLFRLPAFPIPGGMLLLNARFAAFLTTMVCFALALWFARRNRAEVTTAERLPLGALAVAVNALLLWALSLEVYDYFTPERLDASPLLAARPFARQLALTLLWTAHATVLMVVGVRQSLTALRWQALALFGMTVVKMFFYDLADLRGVHRVVSSIALGVVLLFVSFLYQRKLKAEKQGGSS